MVLQFLSFLSSFVHSVDVADWSEGCTDLYVWTPICPIFTHPLNRNAVHMYRRDLAGGSEVKPDALSSVWQ